MSWADSVLRVSPNGHLHFAVIFALLVALVVAIAAPVARSAARDDPRTLATAGASLAQALGLEQGPLATAIGTNALRGDSDRAYTEAVTPLLAATLIPSPLLETTGKLMGNDPAMASLAGPHVTFWVHQDGMALSYSSAYGTVGEALEEAGVTLGPGDVVHPAPESPLDAGTHVYVDEAIEVSLVFGGEERAVYTQATTVGDLLKEQAAETLSRDKIRPHPGALVREGMTVSVTTVRETREFLDEPIPFDTVYEYDSNIPQGEQVVVQEGRNGHLRREHLVTRVDGEEVSSEIVSERVALPVDEVVAIGTRVPPTGGSSPTAASGEEITCARTLNVWATWYTASTSGGSGITRTGTGVYKGIIATDPNVIPLGTEMYVPGYGFGVAADTGGAIKGNMIDLGYGENDVKDWHTGPVDICIIG